MLFIYDIYNLVKKKKVHADLLIKFLLEEICTTE